MTSLRLFVRRPVCATHTRRCIHASSIASGAASTLAAFKEPKWRPVRKQIRPTTADLRVGDGKESIDDLTRQLLNNTNQQQRQSDEQVHQHDSHIGHVVDYEQGIARVSGMRDARMGGIVVFANGARGVVLSLGTVVEVGVLISTSSSAAATTTTTTTTTSSNNHRHHSLPLNTVATFTNELISFPSGQAVVGRVLNALGEPVDDQGPLVGDVHLQPTLTSRAPSMKLRAGASSMRGSSVHRQIATGIKSIDIFNPLAQGTRTALVGDRVVGKSTVALEIIANQAPLKQEHMHCVLVLVGQSAREVQRCIATLRQRGAMAYTTVVVADNTDTPMAQYLCAYSGMAVANYWRDHGAHALVVYDEMTAHARAHAHLMAAMHRPVNINHMHAVLLEESTRLVDGSGGGSSTAVCVVDADEAKKVTTQVGVDVATEIGSMVDEQVRMDSRLAAAKIWPTISWDGLLSLSRTLYQPECIRQLTRRLKSQLKQSQLLVTVNLQDVARDLGIDEDDMSAITLALERGSRLQQLLSQSTGTVYTLGEQVFLVQAWLLDTFDAVPATRMILYLDALHSYVYSNAEAREVVEALNAHCMDAQLQQSPFPPQLLERVGTIVNEFNTHYL